MTFYRVISRIQGAALALAAFMFLACLVQIAWQKLPERTTIGYLGILLLVYAFSTLIMRGLKPRR